LIGLDTNVVIRYLAQDDAAQTRKVSQLMGTLSPDEPGFINLTTLCEIVWVLKRNYHLDKQGLVSVVESLLTTRQLLVENLAVAWKALRAYECGKADFSDAVIAHANLAHGCDYTLTFDRQASRLMGMQELK